jgi:hypothetical protein
MDETPTILRLSIDGRWTADEMARSFRSLNNLYNLRLAVQIVEDQAREFERLYRRGPYPPFDWLYDFPVRFSAPRLFDASRNELRDIISVVDPEDQLLVRRVEYASPGFKDLLGLGEVIKQLGKFVGDIVRMPQESQMRRERIKKMQIDNARRFVRLRLESAEADRRIRHLTKLAASESGPLIELAEDGKLLSAEVLPEGGPE